MINRLGKTLFRLPAAYLVFLAAAFLPCPAAEQDSARALIEALDDTIPGIVASGNSPSVQVAVVQGDSLIWSRAYGADTSVDHVYMNASVQKVFTATAVMQLVEKGLVDLDADVSTYVPFEVRHPGYPDTPVTVRMMLAHRSGLAELAAQFDWDTGCVFYPRFRPGCNTSVAGMSIDEYLAAALTPGGSLYRAEAWINEPDGEYHYSVSTHPFLRYLVEQVAGESYPEYMRRNIFEPLGMTSSGFSADEFPGRHAIPHVRMDGENIELPVWTGNGYIMHTTAADMARFMIAMMNDAGEGGSRVLQPETIELMRKKTSRFGGLFRKGRDLHLTGHGLGMFVFGDGWVGHGGSAPGFQSLWRFNPDRKVGYVILSNVNAVLSGGDNYDSAREEIYSVQDGLVEILGSGGVLGMRQSVLVVVVLLALALAAKIMIRWRNARG